VGLTEDGFAAVPDGSRIRHRLTSGNIDPVADASAGLKEIKDAISYLASKKLVERSQWLSGYYYASPVEYWQSPAAYATRQGCRYARRAGHVTMRTVTFPIWGAAWLTKSVVRKYGVG